MLKKSILFFIVSIFFTVFCSAQDSLELSGKASYYHDDFQGLETSNGEVYNKNDFTAAHRTYPFNTILLVSNKATNQSVVVRVNDRGPFNRSRLVDLSRSAATKIGMVPFGVIPVKIEVLNFLDHLHLEDNMFTQNETRDCYGSLASLNDRTLYIWQTDNLKHAFYMASSLALELKTDGICIRISGPPQKRKYLLLLSCIDTRQEAAEWIKKLKHMGYNYTAVFKDPLISKK